MDYVRPLSNMLDICLVLEPNFTNLEDLACFDSEKFAHLLGNAFAANNIDAIKEFSRSLLWFTYRRNWTSPIGGFGGPISDRGWGCMVRCGQMLLAQCLCLIHLGSKWRWNGQQQQEDKELTFRYRKLLRMFQDKRTSQYSIHQITQMGVSEGKQISEWLGPNTMAQVLKKVVIYDDWSNLAVHVAMDNVLISSDVWIVATQKSQNRIKIEDKDEEKKNNGGGEIMDWERPLLILIPLRLGLTAINECYKEPIVEYFKLPECVGILGGRPNHAVYFYGAIGEKLLYLDPHICQEFKDLDELPPQSTENKEMFTIPSSTTTSSSSSSSSPQYLNNNQSMTTTNSNQHLWTATEVDAPPPLQIYSYNTSPCCSSNCSGINCQLEPNKIASSSIPTSSSISKLSSQNGDCQSQSSSSSSSNLDESPEMPVDSFMDIGGKCVDFFPAECNSNGQNGHESPSSIHSNQQTTKSIEGENLNHNSEGSPQLTNNVHFDDSTFHCSYLLSMDFNSLDPSLALGFLIRNSNEYENLVQNLKEKVLHKSSPPLFEILEKRPKGWPEFSLETTYLQDDSFNIKEYEDLQYDSDEQFELLE